MKKFLLAFASVVLLLGCDPNQSGIYVNDPSQQSVVVTPASNLGDNLNLQALGELVKKSQNAQDKNLILSHSLGFIVVLTFE